MCVWRSSFLLLVSPSGAFSTLLPTTVPYIQCARLVYTSFALGVGRKRSTDRPLYSNGLKTDRDLVESNNEAIHSGRISKSHCEHMWERYPKNGAQKREQRERAEAGSNGFQMSFQSWSERLNNFWLSTRKRLFPVAVQYRSRHFLSFFLSLYVVSRQEK